MKLTILQHTRISHYMWSIHRDGCQAIVKEKREHESCVNNFSGTVDEAKKHILADYADDEDSGYDESYIKVHNCTKETRK